MWFGSASRESFRQPDELPDFPDFFHERFAREFLPHLQFHNVGSFSLYRCRMFSSGRLADGSLIGMAEV
jgi:hypothetical protein